jgi:hypothetical protein
MGASGGQHGSSAAGLMHAYATAVSAGMQRGVPLTDLLSPCLGLRFASGTGTDDPEIPRAVRRSREPGCGSSRGPGDGRTGDAGNVGSGAA